MVTTALTNAASYTTGVDGDLRLRRLTLRVVMGPDRGKTHESTGESVIIGAAPTADFVLNDPRVSRTHCEVAPLSRGVRVKDLDSTNGTFHGEVRMREGVIPPPFELRVGDTRIELRYDEAPTDTMPSDRTWFGPLVGHGPAMRSVFAVLERVAPTQTAVLIEGEPGVGKTTLAEAIRDASSVSEQPRVVLTMATASADEVGAAFRAAGRGTVIVEDIELASTDAAQALMEGYDATQTVVRTISTTRSDLRRMVQDGLFGRELYFRFAPVHVVIRPLRERPEDFHALATRVAAARGYHDWTPPTPLLERLRADDLGQNVRELEAQVLRYLSTTPGPSDPGPSGLKEQKQRLLEAFEEAYVRSLLDRHDHNVSRAAKEAGVARQHLTHLAKKYGIERP
jgi:DNA-binding NtrC family response regulator